METHEQQIIKRAQANTGRRGGTLALDRDATARVKGSGLARSVREPVAREGLQRRIIQIFSKSHSITQDHSTSCIPLPSPSPSPHPSFTSQHNQLQTSCFPSVYQFIPHPLHLPLLPAAVRPVCFTAQPARWQCCWSLGASSHQGVQEDWRRLPLAEARRHRLRKQRERQSRTHTGGAHATNTSNHTSPRPGMLTNDKWGITKSIYTVHIQKISIYTPYGS